MTNYQRAVDLYQDKQSHYEELAESFINGNISFVRGEIQGRHDLIEVLKVIREFYPKEEASFFKTNESINYRPKA